MSDSDRIAALEERVSRLEARLTPRNRLILLADYSITKASAPEALS